MAFRADTRSVVLDPGSYSLRAGHAVDNMPQIDIPSTIGVVQESGASAARVRSINDIFSTNAYGSHQFAERRYFHGVTTLQVPRENMEAKSFMEDGMIEDWDDFETVVDYVFRKCLRIQLEHNAILMSEAPWNPRQKREKTMELMFEKFGVSAFFLAKNAVLSAFASGFSTALVVDSGLTHTTIISVFDGICFKHGIRKSTIAGNYLSTVLENYLEGMQVEVVPQYLVAAKEGVTGNMPAQWTKRRNIPEVTQSWHAYQKRLVIDDIKAHVFGVLPQMYSFKAERTLPPAYYEFPNGHIKKFGPERFRIPETIFQPRILLPQTRRPRLTQMIKDSIKVCPNATRRILYKSILVTGGNSLLKGYCHRLGKELAPQTTFAIRVTCSTRQNTVAERRFGAWIGGANLVNGDSFQKLWISRKEYQEDGPRQIYAKCP